jgi:hypothetical protein
MLSLLFTSLQTSFNTLLSRPFLLGAFLPVFLFLSACAAMAQQVGGTAARWMTALNPVQATSGSLSWGIVAAAAVVFGLSVIVSGLNSFLLELLEGKHLGWLEPWLYRAELARYNRLQSELTKCERELRRFDVPPAAAVAPAPPWQGMITQMQNAYNAGPAAPAAQAGPAAHAAAAPPPPTSEPHSVSLVLGKRRKGQLLTFAELDAAKNDVVLSFQAGHARADPMQDDVLDAVQYGRERLLLEIHRLRALQQFQFPVVANSRRGANSLNVIAATRIGNITRTIRSYSLDRYSLDLNIFWTRLQGAMVKEKDGLSAMQDSKTQVDFLVSLYWLTCLFILLWSFLLIAVTPNPALFLWVSIAGPLLARTFYLAACQNYIVFADLVRGAIDLYRTDLIDQMRLSRPPGNREEHAMWMRVGGWIGYANDTDMNYKP